MQILFLDQSGKLGGAELNLLDLAKCYRDCCLVGLFADGIFKETLEQELIPAQILAARSIQVRKDSSLFESLGSLIQLLPLIDRVVKLSRSYHLIYANTQKALIVGAIASALSHRPLVYHLHDILSPDHFSQTNRRLAVLFANHFAALVIANSQATKAAFIEAGGRGDRIEVIYNGFHPETYQNLNQSAIALRKQLDLDRYFVVGHFSRLSPWKGQHILLEALTHCPENVVAVFVGDALFGEQEYVRRLHQQVASLGLEHRVRFLGFRTDIPQLMAACDLIAHTSIAPEPFGRVIVEAMLSEKPVVAAGAGGTVELVQHGQTGWLTPPEDALKLAEIINLCHDRPEQASSIASEAKKEAIQRFDLSVTNQQITQLLDRVI
jgi:glycosyltransferase involved in cell wall biosynthesis